ncbi:MAG: hypothetical protein RIR51_1890 [Bacteroidota bacterium]|jgi:NADH-quinone oxidoreductase subunit M
MTPWLSIIILLPLIGAGIIFLPNLHAKEKAIAKLFSWIQFILIGWLVLNFDFTIHTYQFKEIYSWIYLNLGKLGLYKIDYSLGLDGLSLILILLSSIISLLALYHSNEIKEKTRGYFSLLLIMNAAIMGCFLVLDLFVFYIFFEFMLLPMFFLIGIWGGKNRLYASVKFFIYTFVGSLLILLAIIALGTSYVNPYETSVNMDLIANGSEFSIENLIAFQDLLVNGDIPTSSLVHSFNYDVLMDSKNIAPNSLLADGNNWTMWGLNSKSWAFWFLFIGFAIKLPMVPFHTWLPDAHVEAPTPISVILAGLLLKIGAYGWLRITFPIFPNQALEFSNILMALGAISIVYGALNAFAQTDLKKLVAYSSVSHMGFVLFGIASMNPQGWQGAIFQSFSHGLLSPMLFLLVGELYKQTGSRKIDDFSGLVHSMPKYATFAGIAFFASLGLPGFSGFIGEFFAIMGGINSQAFHILWTMLAVSGIIFGAGYLLWTYQKIFLGKEFKRNADWKLEDISQTSFISYIILSILTITLGIYPELIFKFTNELINNLFYQFF